MYGASSGRPMIALKFLFSMTTMTMWSNRGSFAAAATEGEASAQATNDEAAVARAMTRRVRTTRQQYLPAVRITGQNDDHDFGRERPNRRRPAQGRRRRCGREPQAAG